MYYTDDPVADAARYDAEQERLLDKLPRCYCCREPITGDYLYKIDGIFYCEDCLNSEFRENTEDFIEE